MTERVPETEAFIQFRLQAMAGRNEHHKFEEIATRLARKRISSNILIATGPVGAGGDQQRDAESFTTRIPDELPHSSGFSAAASTAPVVIACTVQRDRLKAKVLGDLAGICADDAAPVSHVAFFSVHPIAEAATHELQRTARETYGVTLDIFCGTDIATLLTEPDLVWIARHYLELPSSMVPPPDIAPGPQWYTDLLESLRQNRGPAAFTAATQGEVTQGLRFATWDEDANADLPEWLDFMGAFLADSEDGEDTELVFRACYEMAVATFRGLGVAAGVEDLVRRAIDFACTSDHANVVDDAVTLASYWGGMWVSGVGRAEASEIAAAATRLRVHSSYLLERTDPSTHPVRAATLTGTLAALCLLPDWEGMHEKHGRPEPAEVVAHVGVPVDEFDVDMSALRGTQLVDLGGAMQSLDRLVDLLPRARPYSVRQLARVFTMFAPVLSSHPSYEKVRDGLDAATATVEGEVATAERCRDRAMAFLKAGEPLEALKELHNTKVNWFNGDTMYGAVLTMRFLGQLYAGLGLMYAAKMYACAAAALAVSSSDPDVKTHVPKALLEAAGHAQQSGCWVDAAGITEIALLARAQFVSDPFDYDRHPELMHHETNAALELAAIRTYWPELESLIEAEHETTDWFGQLVELVEAPDAGFDLPEEEFQQRAGEQLAGPLLSDIGPTRVIDFQALGVRWIFQFSNDQATVLSAEGLCASLQILLADIALLHPVLIKSTVHVNVKVVSGAHRDVDSIHIDDSKPVITAQVTLSDALDDLKARDTSMVAMCYQLLHSVHARPPAELQDLLEPLFKGGLPHKVSVGRPYEEAAALLGEEHYARCGAATRPASLNGYTPLEREPLAPSRALGPGYNREEALQAIRERYEVANESLRYTLPRLLGDEDGRKTIERLREAGWLDWQILVALVNAAMNWRMQQVGMTPEVADPSEATRLARQAETPQSPPIPLEVFADDVMDLHVYIQTVTVARRWDLRGRQEARDEEAMRDLLIRRYEYAADDIPHRDLLDCLDEDGQLRPLVGPPDPRDC